MASSRFSGERPKSSLTLELDPSLVDLPRYSHLAVRAKPCWGSLEVGGCWALGGPNSYGSGISRKSSRRRAVPVAYRKDNGDASPHPLGAVQLGGLAQPQLLIAGRVLPAQDGGAKEQHLNTLARG